MSFRLFTSVFISIRATHTHSRHLSFTPFLISTNHPSIIKPVPLKSVPLKSVSIIDSPYFHHIRNKKNTIMEIMDLYNKIKK